ncbi:MAG: SpoIID/LytB domain-containing protein [Oscillatoriales cyanobacterium RM2_1_1]|nr:SpoIID/LytB domain-containing protein [Oscillatoriales cyanobacterium SM2_3_0]NJO45399.1 SpoIID/LytB domain-containing protein [Oscillatoriales cyanobacterium RM2_1_1]
MILSSLIFQSGLFKFSLRWIKSPGWTILLSWLIMAAPAQASLLLRIAVADNASQVKVGSSTGAVVRDGQGRTLGQIPANGGSTIQLKNGKAGFNQHQVHQLWIEPSSNGFVWIGNNWYRGKALLVPGSQGLTAINYVDLEQYLYSVLGSEMNGDWPQEALKAQAVAARSYALYKRQRSKGIYDLGDDQSWQVYQGVSKESPGTQTAVNATAGQVLTHGGQVILAVFHSSSGGHTENSEDVWGNPLPYLKGVPDYDQKSPVFAWTKTFSQGDLSQRISGVGQVTGMTPEKASPYGSIISMKVLGSGGSRVMEGDAIARALGLRSTRFRVTRKSGSANFIVEGRGFGHGVGLSQWGAHGLAQNRYNYQQILLYYYQNTALARIQVQ